MAPVSLITEHKAGKQQQQWKVVSGELVSTSAPANQQASGIRQLFVSAFLPVGYPDSVTPDYTGFIAWNTVQAISSYVRGVLSSHAVFKGVGVGSQAATALGAVFQFFVRDILGMAGGIIFAYAAGGNFDSNAKQWRLFADVMNDLAMALDLASPLIPGGFMIMASLGSVARAMVGMAAGATHAALTQHFATAGSNAADISAKADSRERATVIIGSLLGMAVTQRMAENVAAAWLFFAVLTWVHVWANIRALRCLVLSSVNEPRLKLLLQHYQDKEKVLTPLQVSGLESLLVPPLAAAWQAVTSSQQHALIAFGAQLSAALRRAAAAAEAAAGRVGRGTCPAGQQGLLLQQALQQQKAAADRQYLLLLTGKKQLAVEVVLHEAAGQQVQLRAYLHALQLATALHQAGSSGDTQQLLQRSEQWAVGSLPPFLAALQQHGWELVKLFLPRPEWTAEW
ncbi:hypothetical protein OEZ86_011404 [Tetradesmus obliquus]|nr:hypothetical protein OEZ86_011404 [Tetradesmus obliquus]